MDILEGRWNETVYWEFSTALHQNFLKMSNLRSHSASIFQVVKVSHGRLTDGQNCFSLKARIIEEQKAYFYS